MSQAGRTVEEVAKELVTRLSADRAPQSKTLSVEEVAKELGISRNAAYAAAGRGDFPTIRIGKRILVPTAAIRKMLGLAGEAS